MNLRICISACVAMLLAACSDTANGQKGQGAALKTHIDSISYGIGTQVGQNIRDQFRASDMDSLNNAAIASGLRDALDSTMVITSENVNTMVQKYMLDVQRKQMAKQQAENETALRASEAWLSANGKKPGVITTSTGLQYEVITAGKGAKPVMGDQVTVHYRGVLVDGKQVDSSYDKGQPATFTLGQDPLVAGWVEALQLMPVGSKWKVYVPQNLGWGAQGAGADIPPYSTVIFDMELLGIGAK